MHNWEYKIREFTGSGDEFREFLRHESTQEWQLGALGDADELVELIAAPVNQVFLMFQRRIPRIMSATSSSLPLF